MCECSVLTEQEQEENFSKLISFLNSCISAPQTIDLKDSAIVDSFSDYHIVDAASAVSFIKNKICIIGMCKKQQLSYGKVKGAPFVYEYIFILKNDSDSLGCLAFHENPRQRTRIRLMIKSLHKDYQGIIPFKPNKVLQIKWLTLEEINKLPICKGGVKYEVSNL